MARHFQCDLRHPAMLPVVAFEDCFDDDHGLCAIQEGQTNLTMPRRGDEFGCVKNDGPGRRRLTRSFASPTSIRASPGDSAVDHLTQQDGRSLGSGGTRELGRASCRQQNERRRQYNEQQDDEKHEGLPAARLFACFVHVTDRPVLALLSRHIELRDRIDVTIQAFRPLAHSI